jgi:hypothetical protein
MSRRVIRTPAETPGGVVFSPAGARHGHIGIMGDNGRIWNNSSETGEFSASYTADS